ncbi:MAG: NapC/NirT family cytochrome c [Deltaproteobacteria bacterium]|nr:NapC/NirT family cytochrome c [Deltaproteobacteria bacterium]
MSHNESKVFFLLRKYWKIAAAITGFMFVFIVLPLFLTYGSIKKPVFCSICHETLYDDKDYEANDKHYKVSGGVMVGCAECHPHPYFEYTKSEHYSTKTEHKAGCVNCHRPHTIAAFAGYMYLAISPWEEVMEAMTKDMEKWEKDIRHKMAKRVREEFLKDDSRPCKECHSTSGAGMDEALEPHKIGIKENMTCIECHFNLVHKKVPWPEMEAKKERLGIE